MSIILSALTYMRVPSTLEDRFVVDILVRVLNYVSSAPYFWGALGFTTAVGMFVGAIIYDGERKQAHKGILSVLSCTFLVMWMNLSRILSVINSDPSIEKSRVVMAFAGVATNLIVAVAWILGMYLGSATSRFGGNKSA